MDRPDEKTPAQVQATDLVGGLPLKANLPPEDRAPKAREKNIHDTLGAKITHFLIYGVLGFGANSGLSVGITYFLMPKEWIKKPKEAIAKSMSGVFKGTESERMRTANGTLEIMIMMVAGTILTAAMVPFAKNREKIAHWINQKLGRDADVIPEDMKPIPEPKSAEERIDQEIKSRVNARHSSGDLWKARWTALAVPFFGDMALSNWNNKREKAGLSSVDTKAWEAGGKFYDNVLSEKKWVNKVSDFFEKHGAGVGDIEKRAPEKFPVLLKTLGEEAGSVNKTRVMVAEQTRMLSKEVGWTVILAVIMERLVGVFHKNRVKKEERKAISDITREGLVPDGYKVVPGREVSLAPTSPAAARTASWTEKSVSAKSRPEKQENFVATVDSSRNAAGQPALG